MTGILKTYYYCKIKNAYGTIKLMKQPLGGFTIIESMIFLAVSAVMFAGVFAVYRDSQQSTQFSQAVRELESDLNGILNDTEAGVVPSLEDIECRYEGVNTQPTFYTVSGATPGDNNDCIFIGKIIQFGDGTDRETYHVHTLIDRNRTYKAAGGENSTLAVLRSTSAPVFDATDSRKTKWGLEFKRAFFVQGGQVEYTWGAGAAYIGYGLESGESGASTGALTLYAVTPDNAAAYNIANATITKSAFQDAVPNPGDRDFEEFRQQPITICLVGGNDEEAVIDIGLGSGGLNATARFESEPECA